MEEKLFDIRYRKQIIDEIKSDENVQRKIVSYKKQNMQEDNFYQYVKEYLESKLDPKTVSELSIFASINLQRRISKAEASIYKKSPSRKVIVNNSKVEDFDYIYNDMNLDPVMRQANESYKYQGQSVIQIYPDNNQLKARLLLPHHYDVIPGEKNPEIPEIYIISNFDNTSRDRIRRDNVRTGFSQGDKYRDSINQKIADYDDQNLKKERYYVWSKSFNFVMDGFGNILDKVTEQIIESVEDNDPNIMSPLAEFQLIPFVDVSAQKNFEYWVRGYDSLFDATVMLNVIFTSEFQVVEMQGHAQPFYKGSADLMPENIRIGVDKMIFIPVDSNNPVQSDFGFANPGSDLSGIREFRESFLTAFLTSRGLDTGIVSGKLQTSTATSGVERLLQMVEKFEASQEDISLFQNVEMKLNEVICAYINSYRAVRENGALVLKDIYQLSLPQDLNLIDFNIEFAKPEMIKTEMELLEIAEKEIDLGLTSKVHVLMELKGMSKEEAIKHLEEVKEFEGF